MFEFNPTLKARAWHTASLEYYSNFQSDAEFSLVQRVKFNIQISCSIWWNIQSRNEKCSEIRRHRSPLALSCPVADSDEVPSDLYLLKYFSERGQNIPALYVLSSQRVIFQKFTKHDIFNTNPDKIRQNRLAALMLKHFNISHKSFSSTLKVGWNLQKRKVFSSTSLDHWEIEVYFRFKLKCQIASQNFQ